MDSKLFKKFVCLFVVFCFFLNSSGFAQVLPSVITSQNIGQPPLLKYLSVNEENPYNYFNFLMDKGSRNLPKEQLDSAAKELVSFFFLGISIPDSSFWVNLRPDEPDRITSGVLSKTDIGRVLLEQDLLLKKTVSAYLHPQNPKGKEFWSRLYEKIGKDKVNKTEITTSNRVWIVPDEVIVVQTDDGAFIAKARLKVLLENEYLKKNPKDNSQAISESLMKEIILPGLVEEVNEGREFSRLRQVYYSLILAQWFKRSHKNDIAAYSAAINKGDTRGLESQLPWSKQSIWQEYLQSYNKGEYKIKGSLLGLNRMYFSGGVKFDLGPGSSSPIKIISEEQFIKNNPDELWLASNNDVVIESETSSGKISSNGLGVDNQKEITVFQESEYKPGVFQKSFYRGLNLVLGSLILASGVVILNNLGSPEYSNLIHKAGWSSAFITAAFSMPWLKNGIKTKDSSLGWKKTLSLVLAITAFGAFNYYYASGDSKILHDARKGMTSAVSTTVKVAQAVNKNQNKFAIQGQRSINIGHKDVKIDMVKFKVGGLVPGKMEVYTVNTKNLKVDMVAGKEVNEGGLASRDDFLRSRPGSVLSTSLSYYKVEKGENGKLAGLPTAGFKTNGKNWNNLIKKNSISTDGILGIMPDGSVKIVSLDTVKSGKFSLDKMTSYVQMGPVVMEGGKNVLKYPTKGERGLMLFAVTKDGKFLIAPSEVLKGVYGLSYSEAFTLLEEWGKKNGVKIESAIFADGGSRQGVTFPLDALSALNEDDFKELTNTIPFTDNIGSLVFIENNGSSSPISIQSDKLWSKDANFLSAVDYFNTTVISQDKISWENVVNLFSKLMGEDVNAESVRQLNAMREKSAAERGKNLKRQDLPTLIAHKINAASRIIPGFTGGVLELANSKINSEGLKQKDIDNNVRDIATWIYTEIVSGPQFFFGLRGFGDAGGHNRVAWLIMNYFLIKNGYEPFYFKDARQYDTTVRTNTWAIRDLVGASSPIKRNNSDTEIPFKRIFYVDDRFNFRAAVSDYIQKQFPGAKVLSAEGFAQAKRILETQAPFDLIITDLTMGEDPSNLNVEEKEGGKLVSYVRSKGSSRVPIMILSASVKGNEAKLKRMGADYFVDKNAPSGFLEGLRSGIVNMAKKSSSPINGEIPLHQAKILTLEVSSELQELRTFYHDVDKIINVLAYVKRAIKLINKYGFNNDHKIDSIITKVDNLVNDIEKTKKPQKEKYSNNIRALLNVIETSEIMVESDKKEFEDNLNALRNFVPEYTAPLGEINTAIDILDGFMSGLPESPQKEQVRSFLKNSKQDVENVKRHIAEFSNEGVLEDGNIAAFLNDYVNVAKRHNPGVEISYKGPESRNMRVNFNEYSLRRVLDNMVNNAIVHGFGGVEELKNKTPGESKIGVVLEAVDDQAQVIIRDNGQGVKSGTEQKIFDYEFTTGGTGIGLSSVKDVIKKHNGAVVLAESQEGWGATFKITLPLASSPVQNKNIQSPLIETLKSKGFNVEDFQDYIRELINNELIDGVIVWGNVTSVDFTQTKPRIGLYLILKAGKEYSEKPRYSGADAIALNGIEEGIKAAINGRDRFDYNIMHDAGPDFNNSTVQFFDKNSLVLLSDDFVSDNEGRLKRLNELNQKLLNRKLNSTSLENVYSLNWEGWENIKVGEEASENQAPAGVSLKNTDASSSPIKEKDRMIFPGQDVNAILKEAVTSLPASIFNSSSIKLELGNIPVITGALQDSQKYDQELTAFQIKGDGWAKTLSSVFSHLAHNSGRAKASEMVITTGLSADGNNILIEVKDNGQGIDKSLLDNGNIESIFEKDRSFRESPRPDQAGLGLYYSRIMVANQMGGTIEVVREEPGVTFRISLPVNPLSADKGGIDLSNIKITLKNEEFVSSLNAADLKILRAAKALNENWDSLAVLYMHELMLLLKQNIASDITQRPALLNILSRLDSHKSLDEEVTVFYHTMLS